MSILAEKTAQNVSSARWGDKVKCTATTAPWWPTQSVIAVCEVSVANAFTVLVHVCRSQKSGKVYSAMPSTKRGDKWLPVVTIDDPALREAIEAVAENAVRAAQVIAPAQHEDDADEMPF